MLKTNSEWAGRCWLALVVGGTTARNPPGQ